MIVVMAPNATDQDIEQVNVTVRSKGLQPFVSRGQERAIIGLVGDIDNTSVAEKLSQFPGVERAVRVSTPYKLIARDQGVDPSG